MYAMFLPTTQSATESLGRADSRTDVSVTYGVGLHDRGKKAGFDRLSLRLLEAKLRSPNLVVFLRAAKPIRFVIDEDIEFLCGELFPIISVEASFAVARVLMPYHVGDEHTSHPLPKNTPFSSNTQQLRNSQYTVILHCLVCIYDLTSNQVIGLHQVFPTQPLYRMLYLHVHFSAASEKPRALASMSNAVAIFRSYSGRVGCFQDISDHIHGKCTRRKIGKAPQG